MLMDRTATELADALDGMRDYPHNTGGMSMLDGATTAFGALSPELGEAQRAFAVARSTHHRSWREGVGYSDADWATAIAAADRLATALRALGDVRIERCKRQAGWGTCNLPLGPDGECHSSLGHEG